MEAASRPPLEALPDLPVEEPLDPAKAHARASAAPPAAAAAPAGTEAVKSKDLEQTDLNFVDPEIFLAAGQEASAKPVMTAAEQATKAPEPPLELELEDPVVDEMLTAPPPPPPPGPRLS